MTRDDEYDALRDAFLEDMGMSADPAAAPTVVGPYRIVELLGEGAFGRVYHAIHQDLLKHVALKVVETGPGTPTARIERFRREAQTAARLRHDNIIGVHDVGTDGARHWLAMDLEPRRTLAAWLDDAHPSLEDRLRVVAKIARAVDHAHREGVLHRDLKPGNILMRDDGEPVVVDFGLARGRDDESLTVDGAVLGTPAYMAPEQLRGAVSTLDARTDVYALGVVLYEAVTGRRPFAGETADEIHAQAIRRAFTRPTAVRSDLPSALDILCARCLEPERDLRPPDAGALADDLERLLRGEPTAARPVSRGRRVLRELRSRRAVTVLGGLLLLTVAAAAAFTSRQRETLDLVSYAHEVQTAYGELTLRLAPVLSAAEEERYVRSTAADVDALVGELDRRLDAAADTTGVADAFRAWVLFLLGHDGAAAALEDAADAHPHNPFVPLTAARTELLRYAERAYWPSFAGVSLYPTDTPFQSLAPNETPEMRDALERARAAVVAARATEAWDRLPALRWIDDLCAGFERYAAGDMDGAVVALTRIDDRADLQFDVHLLLALAHCRRGDDDQALRAAQTLARLRPNLRPAVSLLGACHRFRAYQKLSRREDPLEDFLAARVVFSSWRNKDDFAGDLGQLHAAIGIAREMAGEDPEDDLEEALRYLAREVEENGEDYRNLTNRAMVRAHLARLTNDVERLDAAVDDIERAFAESDGHGMVATSRTQVHVARLYARVKQGAVRDRDFAAARRAFDDAEECGAPSREMHYARAGLAYVEGEYFLQRRSPAAAETLKEAIRHATAAAGPDGSFLEARQIACGARVYLALQEPTATKELLAIAEEALLLRRAGLPKSIDPLTIASWLARFVDDPRRDGRTALGIALEEAWELAVSEDGDDVARRGMLLLARVGVGRAEETPRPTLDAARDEAVALAGAGAPGSPTHAIAHAVLAELHALADEDAAARAALDAARANPAATPFLRRVASRLNADAWLAARDPEAGAEAWVHARDAIELALAATPDDGLLLNTLGVVRLRTGDAAGALDVLRRSDARNRERYAGGHPADVAFLCLAHHALGDDAAAATAAARLAKLMENPAYGDDPECRGFAGEVRARQP